MKQIPALFSAIVTGILLSPLAIIMLSAALFVLLIPVNMLLNNADLKTFSRSFAAIEHPSSTESLATYSRVGNLGCASNHCDYFIGNLRVSSLSQTTIRAYYEDISIPSPPDPYFEESTEVQLWFFDDEMNECAPEVDGLFNEQTEWDVDLSRHRDKTIYIAYAEATGAPPGADIRCH